MRFVPVSCLREGMSVANNLYDRSSKLLLRKGRVLKPHYIQKIRLLGYQGVYIDDDLSQDIEITSFISDELRLQAVRTVKDVFVYSNLTSKKNSKALQDKMISTKKLVEEIIAQILASKDMIVNMVDLKVFDQYTFYHSVNVTVLAIVLGIAYQLDSERLYKLGVGALLHDIGKVFVDKDILNKVDKLTDEEYEEIKKHTIYGYQYLKESFDISPIVYGSALHHHEKYDGTGYPNQLKGDDISLYGRIISLCDVYDALTSNRPYRGAMLPSDAMEYIMANCGTFFDPKLVLLFVKKVAPYPVGTGVKLSNGLSGIVADNYEECAMRPKIKIVRDENEMPIEPYILDLRDDLRYTNITIIATVDFT